jgi:hypothetical protein
VIPKEGECVVLVEYCGSFLTQDLVAEEEIQVQGSKASYNGILVDKTPAYSCGGPRGRPFPLIRLIEIFYHPVAFPYNNRRTRNKHQIVHFVADFSWEGEERKRGRGWGLRLRGNISNQSCVITLGHLLESVLDSGKISVMCFENVRGEVENLPTR